MDHSVEYFQNFKQYSFQITLSTLKRESLQICKNLREHCSVSMIYMMEKRDSYFDNSFTEIAKIQVITAKADEAHSIYSSKSQSTHLKMATTQLYDL